VNGEGKRELEEEPEAKLLQQSHDQRKAFEGRKKQTKTKQNKKKKKKKTKRKKKKKTSFFIAAHIGFFIDTVTMTTTTGALEVAVESVTATETGNGGKTRKRLIMMRCWGVTLVEGVAGAVAAVAALAVTV
jgi:hypothetical protein